MTSSEAVGSAQGLKGKSKHWANFLRSSLGWPRSAVWASDAEDLFFEWFIGGP